MQLLAELMAPLIAPPSVNAAIAIPEPTIARINAYSAADAPLSSAAKFFKNLVIVNPRFSAETISSILQVPRAGATERLRPVVEIKTTDAASPTREQLLERTPAAFLSMGHK